MNLENSEALYICSCCKSLSRWMMHFLQRNWHHPPSWPFLPAMKSNIWIMGMNVTSIKQGPCCILMCEMTTSHNKISWTKNPYGGVWTTFSNGCNSVWWTCSYKCNNLSFMLAKTIVEDISFYVPYIQICDNQHTC